MDQGDYRSSASASASTDSLEPWATRSGRRAARRLRAAIVVISLAVCSAVPHGQTSQSGVLPADDRPAAISGRVLDAATGAPITGAVVSLRQGGSASSPTGLPPIDSQATDQYGRFLLTGVAPGRAWEIVAQKAGYFDGAFGTEATGGVPRRVVLEDGQWLRDAEIALWRPSAISGTVTDEAGEPVVGAYVAVLARILVSGEPSFASGPVTRTDDRGAYRIAPLTAGSYALFVPSIQVAVASDVPPNVGARFPHALQVDNQWLMFAEGAVIPPPQPGTARRQAYPPTFHPGVRSAAGAATIDLAAGEDRRGIDIQWQPAPVSRVSGRLEGPADAVAHRRLRLMAAGTEHLGLGHEAAVALAGKDGSFAFPNVSDGQYTLLADGEAGSYDYRGPGVMYTPSLTSVLELASMFAIRSAPAPAIAATLPWRSGPGPLAALRVSSSAPDLTDAYFGQTSVAVAGAEVANVVVRMRQGGSIRARFATDTALDRSTLREITPYLELAAEPAGINAPGRQVRGGVVPDDPGLEFSLTGLIPGLYALRFVGYAAIIKSVVWNGKDYTGRPLPLGSGDERGLTVTLTTQIARLDGIVRDQQGRPVRQGAVVVFPVDRTQWRGYGPQPDRLMSVIVRNNGTFTVPRLPAGDYHVVAVEEGLAHAWKDPAFLEAAARVAARVSLDWGESRTQDFTLTAIPR